jgi:hypothetical protein
MVGSSPLIRRQFAPVARGGPSIKTGHAIEQDRPDVLSQRRTWFDGQLDLDPERLVFIDETWTTTNMTRSHGRCAKGERLRMGFPHGHRKTTTLVAGLRMTGMVAPMVLDGPINGDWFEAYVTQVLVPELRPGDVVIMDMCGRPLWSKHNLRRRMACGSGADMCPASDAAMACRGPVWEFADRVQNNLARLR